MGRVDAPSGVRIGAPRLTRTADSVTYEVEVVNRNWTTGPLWFTVKSAEPEAVSARADAALLALLVPAMRDGLDIEVEGVVSSELLHNLAHGVQQVLRIVMPFLSEIAITATQREPSRAAAAGVGTGFSAGIDSYTTLRDHHFSAETPAAYRVTHLLFNNVGSHGPGDQGHRLFQQRLSHVLQPAERMGLPLISVDSNLDDFYGSLDFLQTHTLRNASVAFLLQDLLGTFLYSSGVEFHRVSVHESTRISVLDPVLLPMLTTPAIALRSVGSEYRRVQKVVLISELPETWHSLDVCAVPTEAGTNCSVCFKCLPH